MEFVPLKLRMRPLLSSEFEGLPQVRQAVREALEAVPEEAPSQRMLALRASAVLPISLLDSGVAPD